LGHAILMSVEEAKIALTTSGTAACRLDAVEEGPAWSHISHDALGEKSDCPRCSCEILAICCSGSGQAARAAAEPSGRPLYAAESRTQFAEDSSLEGTGFEPSVPLLQKALLGVANRDVGTISGTT
jgi:hypothetical protein